ncbi:MAG: hypothetical protein IPJ61_14285 [Tessaracoccus sp.]|uniref:hypothetical protein n=1 Tax=Tessaracoccus sp. TaxID=1971211 RepID=UPI001EC77DF9|nr:hypothetical protein [Tessaracoccus sp.]MBK7822181.1 hypothetical protein [Tessaracoccus sp.]
MALTYADTARLEELMNRFLERALVVVYPEDAAVAAGVEMDAADRHVLAAALSADADILLTDNTRHFPRVWMAEHGIEVVGAGDLLVRLAEQYPEQVRAAHMRTLLGSPKTEVGVLDTLRRAAGTKAYDAVSHLSLSS